MNYTKRFGLTHYAVFIGEKLKNSSVKEVWKDRDKGRQIKLILSKILSKSDPEIWY